VRCCLFGTRRGIDSDKEENAEKETRKEEERERYMDFLFFPNKETRETLVIVYANHT